MMLPIKSLLGHKYLFILAVIFQVGVTVMMLISSSGLPGVEIPFFDKIAHMGVYAVSLLLWVFVFFKSVLKKNTLVSRVFGVLLLYGMVIEVVQGKWIPDRSFDLWDVMANILGMTIGILVFYILRPFWPPKK